MLDAGFMREVLHPEWLANPVVVPKANGKLRMCVDYTNLNKACPKDPYQLPRIDQMVDSTAGCDLLCFLDEYSRYHQISMAAEDEEKTTFTMLDVLLFPLALLVEERWSHLSADHVDHPEGFPTKCR